MEIADFSYANIKEAMQLAKINYEEKREFVPALPPVDSLPDLSYFVQNGYGSAALEHGKMLGFLCFYPPIDNAFGTTNVRGTLYSKLLVL